jgi:hypothetical protein
MVAGEHGIGNGATAVTETTARTKIDLAEPTRHGKRGKRDEKNRVLTPETLVCSTTTGMAGDGGNRRWRPVGVAAVFR